MSFANFFRSSTGYEPFPWQSRLFTRFANGEFPATASIPTGLGKTSIVAVWLIALALHPEKVPRRLVYVVNRRTVVDQTTTEVENLRSALTEQPRLKEIADRLHKLCALPLPSPAAAPLAISTLRGQFADNRGWSADPTRPAVIIGTVDMIGSGLLFSRYTVGFKLRPHHAAFLAQDALLVHDEAHLEPAFQKLLDSIVVEQARANDPRKLRIMELTATTRSNNSIEPFRISKEDSQDNEIVDRRLNAVKNLSLLALGDSEKEPDKITELALDQKDSGRAILVFVRSVANATKIAAELGKKLGKDKKNTVRTLTGTMRGKERDELVKEPVFQRFLARDKQKTGTEDTVFLVATSAGEVGINISANDLICDLSTYESMAQRFGRVNRFGECDDSSITVVYPPFFGKKDKKQDTLVQSEMDVARERTLALLQQLETDASSAALERLPAIERAAAFSPPPQMRVATAIQFDAWALTSIRKPISARPPVAPYLHGEADEWQPPETHLAWRKELDVIYGDLLSAYQPEDLLEDFPLKPHELLRDTSQRIAETLSARIEIFFQESQEDEMPKELHSAWLVHEDGSVALFELAPPELLYIYKRNKERNEREKKAIKEHKESLKNRLANATLILPASLGGISKQGLFTADAKSEDDKADVSEIEKIRRRLSTASPNLPCEYSSDYRLVRAIDTKLAVEEAQESPTRYWLWLEAKKSVNGEKRSAIQPETLSAHSKAVTANIKALAAKLFPAPPADGEPNIQRCFSVVGQWHDKGKDRRPWQICIGNTDYNPIKPETIFAKSGGSMRPRNLAKNYRHEFGSINDVLVCSSGLQTPGVLADFSEIERDIILHLIAAHHGRARPHFPSEEILDYATDPDDNTKLATEIPRRFARLQQHFGRWGLAWVESILRSADYAASAGIVADDSMVEIISKQTLAHSKPNKQHNGKSTIMLRVDVANPGQYFACCGLFELAARLAPDANAHFEQDDQNKEWRFVITESAYSLDTLLEKIAEAEISPASDVTAEQDDNITEEDEEIKEDPGDEEQAEDEDKNSSPLFLGNPFHLRLDWWKTSKEESTSLKVWAGSMNVLRIASAMKNSITQGIDTDHNSENLLQNVFVVYKQEKKIIEDAEEMMKGKIKAAEIKEQESMNKAQEVMEAALEQAQLKTTERARVTAQKKAEEKFELAQQKAREIKQRKQKEAIETFEHAQANAQKKVEPFYFDARRGPNADSRDVGFSPNSLTLETVAAPAVEILCLIGLQRAIPVPGEQPRQFIYHLWSKPLPITILAAAINGQMPDSKTHSYRFESWFRTSQRKHKAFLAARPIICG